MRLLLLLRVAVVIGCLVPVACAVSPAVIHEGARSLPASKPVRVSVLPGERLRLLFDPVVSSETLNVLEVVEARAVLEAFHDVTRQEEQRRFRLLRTSWSGLAEEGPALWESRLRAEYQSRFGPPLLRLPKSLETSPIVLALRLSPRYMGSGVREAAQELFNSPAFVVSVALSIGLYFAAWLAPEPFFSKSFAAAVTVRLALVMGLLELRNLALACLELYREAEAAKTVEALETVAERFGKAMGGTALRALVLAVSFGIGKALPQVPEGGLDSLLGPPRYSLPGGLTMGGSATAHVVADGSLILTAAMVGTAASTLNNACGDGATKKDGYRWHHIATDKNVTSTAQGGPWTPLFEDLFMRAGMSLNDAENLVYLNAHQGPHPEAYHEEVHRRLEAAVENCQTVAHCRAKLTEALGKLVDELCTPGSRLNRLVTKDPH